MHKDACKQSHRGIGFVTFSSSDSVEAVMSTPHSLNGQELAIDRATPKDKVCILPVHHRQCQFNSVGHLLLYT